MECFRKIADQLSVAVESLGSERISLWDDLCYGDLFERHGWGGIRPWQLARQLPGVMAALGLTKDASPAYAERLICERYRQYRTCPSFWTKAWMWLSEPVAEYQRLYTLISLRDLHKTCAGLWNRAERIALLSTPETWGSFFGQVLAGLGDLLVSLLPRETGFFTGLFESRATCDLTDALKEFSESALLTLRTVMEKGYMTLLQKVLACRDEDERQACIREIDEWYSIQGQAISENNRRDMDQESKLACQALLESLRIKSGLLKHLLAPQGNHEVLAPGKEKDGADAAYVLLSARLENIENDCSLQIRGVDENDDQAGLDHSHRLERDFFGSWHLTYHETPASPPIFIEPGDIPNLEVALSQTSLDYSGIRDLIVRWHRGSPGKGYPASWYGRLVDEAAPARLEQDLLQAYSREVEMQLAEGRASITAEQDLQLGARKLHAYSAYLKGKSDNILKRHEVLADKARLYNQLDTSLKEKAAEAKTAWIHTFRQMKVSAEEMTAGLRQQYDEISKSSLFQVLSKKADDLAGRIQHQLGLYIENAREYFNAFKALPVPDSEAGNSGDKQDIPGETSVREKKIHEAFARVWREMDRTDYPCARQKLEDTARQLFHEYLALPLLPANTFRQIHLIGASYLRRLEQGTRAIVPFRKEDAASEPARETLEAMQDRMARERDSNTMIWDKIERLRREFDEELDRPQYSQCAWIKIPGMMPDKTMLKTLPACFNPAYVYATQAPLPSMYYVDRQTSHIKQIRLFKLDKSANEDFKRIIERQASGTILSQDKAMLITRLTNHSFDRRIYLYASLLKQLVRRVEGIMWGIYAGRTLLGPPACGLLFLRGQARLEKAEKLPWSHYLCTSDNELYYYCKYKNTLKPYPFYSPKDKAKFARTFSARMSKNRLDHLDLMFLGEVTVKQREEDQVVIGIAEACAMARQEIAVLVRSISRHFHPDKNPLDEEWQKIIAMKEMQAYEKLDGILKKRQGILDDLFSKNYTKETIQRMLMRQMPVWIGKNRDKYSKVCYELMSREWKKEEEEADKKWSLNHEKRMAEIDAETNRIIAETAEIEAENNRIEARINRTKAENDKAENDRKLAEYEWLANHQKQETEEENEESASQSGNEPDRFFSHDGRTDTVASASQEETDEETDDVTRSLLNNQQDSDISRKSTSNKNW